MAEPRTYAGWKAGLTVVFAVIVFVVLVNVVLERFRAEPRRGPDKVVTTVSPTG